MEKTSNILPLKLCIRLSLVVTLLFFFNRGTAQVYKSADEIPDPKASGQNYYISDAANVLQSQQIDSLNTIINELQKETGVEAAVVIVNDFNKDQDDFSFATQLFRRWGIGKKYANNGLLLFITVDRKQYRFITGYGLEGLLPDADLRSIGEHNLVPYFKNEQYGTGIILTLHTISSYLKQPANHKELSALLQKTGETETNFDWLWAAVISVALLVLYMLLVHQLKKSKPVLPKSAGKNYTRYEASAIFILIAFCIGCFLAVILLAFTGGFKYIGTHLLMIPVVLYIIVAILLYIRYLFVLAAVRKQYNDDVNFAAAVHDLNHSVRWGIIISPLLLLRMQKDKQSIQKINERFMQAPADTDGNPMTRVNRDENKSGTPYLSQGQRAEEKQQVYKYDIWVGNNNEVKLVPNEAENYASFAQCPKCGFRTLDTPHKVTVVGATTKRTGKEKEIRTCKFCHNEELIAESVIPVLVAAAAASSSSRRDDDDDDDNSSSSSDSSSSSSDSGSWGGGDTGGGGAGGSW